MGMGVALLMIALLLFKKQRKYGELYLVAWIGVCFAQMLFYELTLYQEPGILSGIPAILGFALVLLNMPLLHGYIRYMMGIPLKPKGLFFHLSPYLLYAISFTAIIYSLDLEVMGQLGYLVFDKEAPPWLHNYALPSAILSPLYCGWNLWLLQKHRDRLPQLFSYREHISLAWIQLPYLWVHPIHLSWAAPRFWSYHLWLVCSRIHIWSNGGHLEFDDPFYQFLGAEANGCFFRCYPPTGRRKKDSNFVLSKIRSE